MRLRAIRTFLSTQRANAAMEFAIIAPVLVLLLLGVYEICNAAIVYEEVQNAAHSIPASASNLAVQSTGATALSYPQIQLAASEVWAQIPELRTGFQNGAASVTITSVTFLKTALGCTPTQASHASCNYTPTVAWSVAYTGGTSGRFTTYALRSCTGAPTVSGQANATVTTGATPTVVGGLNNEAASSAGISAATVPTWKASDLTSLPTFSVATPDPNWVGPSPILVVDVHLKYQPVFGLFIPGGVDFYGTGLFPVRSVQTSKITTNGNNTTTTAQSLAQQYTTILNDLATDGATTAQVNAGIIPNATAGSYCINISPNLNPAAQS